MLNIKDNYIKYFENTRLLTVSGILAGLLLSIFMLPMGITFIVSSIFFIIFCGRKKILIEKKVEKSQILSLNLLFFISSIVISLLLYSDARHRTILFFVTMSIIFTLLGIEILFYLSDSTLQLNFILLKIIISSFVLYMSVLLTSNSLIGVDIWYHKDIILNLLEIGHIPNIGRYSYFPVYNLIVSICSLITNLGFKEAVTFSIGFIYAFSLIFMYLVGKMLYDTQLGLISTLFISFTSYYVQRGYWLVPQSLGISLFFVILYLVLKSMDYKSSFKHKPLFKYFLILFILLLNMTHNLSVLTTLVILIILYSCFYLFNFILNDSKYKLSQNFILLYLIMMLSYWTYVYYIYPFLAHVVARKMTLESVQIITYDTLTLIINQFGFLLLISLSIFGIFYGLSKKKLSTINYSFMFTSFLFLFLIEVFQLANIGAFVPQRWIVFASILLAIPASYGIIFLKSIDINHRKLTISIILVLFSFFMITSTVANNDSPIYSKAQTEKFGLSDCEIYSANTINAKYSENMSTDLVYYLYFYYELGNHEGGQLNPNSTMVILRETLYENSKYYEIYRNYDLIQYNFTTNPNYFKVYQSNSVNSYLHIDNKDDLKG